MATPNLTVDRRQILAFRRTTGVLGSRLPKGSRSLRTIAWAGLQDSMPRAAVLSVHARMEGTDASVWEHDAFVQVWGPRYSVFVVPARDAGLFTLGRMPDDESGRNRAYETADRLAGVLGGATMAFGQAGRALGVGHNSLRYAAPTGRVVLRWDGARQPTVRIVEPPDIDPIDARKELARRYLHVYGPATAGSFGTWAGIRSKSAAATFAALHRSLTQVATPIGEQWILNRDVDALRGSEPEPSTRLLPSGDAYYLLQDDQRKLLIPRANRRERLWTSRVWPGAILADGEIVGTWRRAKNVVRAELWARVPARTRQAIAEEATSLPIDGAEATKSIDFVT